MMQRPPQPLAGPPAAPAGAPRRELGRATVWRYFWSGALGWTVLTVTTTVLLVYVHVHPGHFTGTQAPWLIVGICAVFWVCTLGMLYFAAYRARRRIVERNAALRALSESERRYRLLLESAHEPVTVVTEEGFVYVNPAFCRLLGYPDAQALLVQPPSAVAEPEDLALLMERYSSRLQGGNPPRGYEARLVRKDGGRVWVEVHGQRIEYEGRPALQVECYDLTARKAAEEALRSSEARFRNLVENMEEGVLLVEEHGVCEFVNVAAARMAGYRPEEILGRSIFQFVPLEDRALLHEQLELRRQGMRSSYETRGLRPDGRRLDLLVNASPRYDRGGAFIGSFVLLVDITERKQTERALQESEQRFRGLVEGTSEVIVAADERACFTYANPVAERVFGLPVEELAGKEGMTFVHPDDLPAVQRAVQEQVARNAQHLTFDCRIVGRQGQVHHVLWTADPLFDREGRPIGAYAIGHDITERQRLEEEARLNEARLEALVRLNQMAGADEQEICHFALEEGVALTRSEMGYLAFVSEDEQESTLYAWSERALAQCQTAARPSGHRVAETGLWGEAIRQRRPVITNDYSALNPCVKDLPAGHVPLARHMNVPVFEGQRIAAVAGVGNKPVDYDEADVRQLSLLMSGMWRLVQRRRAQEALRDREAQLSALVGSFDGLIYTVAPDFRLEYVNQRVRARLGRDPAGETCHEALYGLLTPCPWCQPDAVLSGRTLREEIRSPADGRYYYMIASPVERAEGAVSLLAMVHDITERKQAETALMQQQREESIATLAGGIAHDFNNILLGVLGSATLLAESLPAGHSGRELCELISTSARRMADLTDKLVAYARGGRYETVPVDVNQAVADTLAMLRGSQPGQVQTQHIAAPQLWPVLADPGQLNQVLLNLVVNAYEAMAAEGGTLTILTENARRGAWTCWQHRSHPAGDYVHIAVSDTGPGMDEEAQIRVFEPYFSTKATGRGLGLAVVLGIVRNHGGCIVVDSAPGRGSVFHVYLPRGSEALLEQRASAPADFRGTGTVLVVDDEELVLSVAQRILARSGYTVLTAKDGLEGLELARQHAGAIDLAILDVQMPQLDGLRLAAQLRAEGLAAKVLLSSGFNDATEDRAARSAADGYVRKPYGVDELLNAVRAALDQPAPGATAAAAGA